MAKLTKKFNAESLLRDLNQATEAQILAMQNPDNGVAGTILETASQRLKLGKAAKGLAKALDIPKGPVNHALFLKLAEKSEEQKIPGADRLKQLMDWNKNFWSQQDVKAADQMVWHPIKGTRLLKELAQKQPKP